MWVEDNTTKNLHSGRRLLGNPGTIHRGKQMGLDNDCSGTDPLRFDSKLQVT